MVTWVDLQERIKILFDDARVQKFEPVLEKDKNGWNWILNFQKLADKTFLILHTKLIFKLDENKEKLRANEFLYLYDMNCKYRVVRFNDLNEMDSKLKTIFFKSQFGKDLMTISEFMIEPAQNINTYFYENDIQGYSVFEFNYIPKKELVPCQDFRLKFNFNVNNKDDVTMKIKKISQDKFKISFKFLNEKDSMEIENLDNLASAVAQFIKRNLKA